jgi:hypothetical protein
MILLIFGLKVLLDPNNFCNLLLAFYYLFLRIIFLKFNLLEMDLYNQFKSFNEKLKANSIIDYFFGSRPF